MTDLVAELAQLIVRDNAILFVGASLRQAAQGPPAAEQIADALAARIDYQRADRSLPAVARDFEVLRGRRALIAALREESERLGDHPAAIHHLIADAVLPTTKIITNRFDRSLEQALDQVGKPYVLIVRDTDVPFFDASKVTLIKLQGDLSQPDSLIVTEDDLDSFVARLPTISDVVRAFFATKSLIFLGYDLASDAFKRFFRQVTRNLASYRRVAYAIAPQPLDAVEQRYWESQSVQVHVYDPLDFLQMLAESVKAAVRPPPTSADSLSSSPPPVLPDRPYKALASFTAADAAIFSGRMEESQRLTNRILAHRVVILHGESGSGKTSLLQAGVSPLLAQQRAALALCAPAPAQPLLDLIRDAFSASDDQGPDVPLAGTSSLADLIRARQRAQEGPVVLAIDQFEQFLLLYSPAERAAAVAALADLAADRSLDLRLVLVIRDDFLGRLQTFESRWPGLLDVRFRLDRLGREEARAAIEGPAALFGVSWEPALVEALLDDLAPSADGAEASIAPPQLQIVCDRLYQAATATATVVRGASITLALYRQLGGAAAILGDHLDAALGELPLEQQPTARALLGALVSSAGVKQRLALPALARAADVAPADAAAILDALVRQRIVQRYELAGQMGAASLEYELTHDTLAARIARWLGEEFWAAQRLREIVRAGLLAWQRHGRLLAPDDLKLAAAQQGRVRLAPEETQLLYAAAVAYAADASPWQVDLAPEGRRLILLRLLQHDVPAVRAQAVAHLPAVADAEASAALAEAALADPDAAVRAAAAVAIAQPSAVGAAPYDEAALAALVEAVGQPTRAAAARRALALIRDRQPACQPALPPSLRGPLQREAWRARWQRRRDAILFAALRGLQGGFWGLGLGLGLFLGLNSLVASGFDRIAWQAAIGAMSVGVPLAGVIGALAAGAAAFARAVLSSVEDRPRPRRAWALAIAVGAAVMGIGFVFLGAIFAGTLQIARAIAAGALIGGCLTAAAALPDRLPPLARPLLASAVGIAGFVLAWRLGLLFNQVFWWLLAMGAMGGLGFWWGLEERS